MDKNPFEEKYLVIAEKPSVARTIASVLGIREKKDGYMEGPDGVVSWCYGHLAEYAMPDAYDGRYRKWSLEALPVIPEKWLLVPERGKEEQLKLLCGLLNDKSFDYVVNAADCAREGELIFNRVYELSGSTLPVKRLWISSLEDDAIMKGFMSMKGAEEYRNLAAAAVCRAQADWLVGMNASRAFTKVYDYRLSIGRVQSPTLALLARRQEEITSFRKQQFFVTHLTVKNIGREIDAVSERFSDREEANRLAGMCSGRPASVPSITRRTKTIRPPKLYDLTTLQRDANRLFGYTASKTLECAQALYEKRLITYPRTDSNYLSDDMGKSALDVISACSTVYPDLFPDEAVSFMPDTRRILDSGKVTDHHAIIPTVEIKKTGIGSCREKEKKILALIASRLICAVSAPHVYESVKASFLCCGYTFSASGMSVKEEGWKAAEAAMRRLLHAETENKDSGEENPADRFQDLSSLYQGAQFSNAAAKVTEHWTQPPKTYTEDTLLLAMEKAGTPEMESDVEKKGLGTPATRAGIIEKLVRSGYAERSNKQLSVTESGKMLVQVLPDYLKSAKMTADWENQLLLIERGQYEPAAFMAGIQQLVCRMVEDCRQIDESEKARFAGAAGQDPSGGKKESGQGQDDRKAGNRRNSLGKCPVCGSPVYEGQKNFYCSDRGCRFTLWKENRFLDRLRTRLDEEKVKALLACGRTTVKDLYSVKKDKLFTADILMEWKDGRACYSLDFPEHEKRPDKN